MFKYFYIIGIIIIVSCQYSPTGTNYNHIPQPNSTVERTIDLENIADTLAVWDYARIYYALNSTSEEFEEMYALLDNTVELKINKVSTNKYKIQFNTTLHSAGPEYEFLDFC